MKDSRFSREVKNMSSQFCINASAHGFYHLHSNKNISRKIFWLFLLAIIFAATTLHIYFLVSSYLKYSYYTAVTSDSALDLKVSIVGLLITCWLSISLSVLVFSQKKVSPSCQPLLLFSLALATHILVAFPVWFLLFNQGTFKNCTGFRSLFWK